MYYGRVSWIPIAVFGGTFLIRYLRAQHRRGGPPAGGPGMRSPFTTHGPDGPGHRSRPVAPVGQAGSSAGTAAGWFRDPFVRHEQRFWSGTDWTDHVMDDGVPRIDPPPAPSGRRDQS